MPRFFVSPQELTGSQVLLRGDAAAHAAVLRLSPGDTITLCDGQGMEAEAEVLSLSGKELLAALSPPVPSDREPSLRCSVYLGFPKADKLEHVIQKATELGAWEIVAFPCSRSVARHDAASLSKKLDRWQRIALSAAEQSGRGRIPQVLVLPSLEAAAARAAQTELPLLFYENERAVSLQGALPSGGFSSAAILTGPEGGLTPEEVEAAREAGMTVCTLGKRILRCETAPLCALSALMFAAGELA